MCCVKALLLSKYIKSKKVDRKKKARTSKKG